MITTLQILESCSAVVDDSNDDNVLHIGGIFPIGGKGGWQGGQVSFRFDVILLKYEGNETCCQLFNSPGLPRHIMQPEISLPCSEEFFTVPCPAPDQASPYHPILFLGD